MAGSTRRLEALCEAFAPPGSDPGRLAAQVEETLRLLDGRRRARILAFLAALPIDRLAPGRGGLLLRWLGRSRVPALRSGFQALKRLVLFHVYAGVDAPERWPELEYPGPRGDAASGCERERPLALARLRPAGDSADVVVIGSGAGGGVAAAMLAERGFDVLLLEAGRAWSAGDADQLEGPAMRDLYLEHGLCATEDLGIAVLAGACLGGGTTVNWCTSLRLRPSVAQEWSRHLGYDVAAELAPHYAAVEARLETAPASWHNAQNAALLRGCKALGWTAAAMPRNATPDCPPGCGYCGFGCAYGRKASTPRTFLRDAVARGARVVVEARVERVLLERGAVVGVRGTAGPERRPFTVRTPRVVAAAGSLRTPALLARSGVTASALGRHLHLHPVSAIIAEFDDPVDPWLGPMQSAYCDAFAELDGAYGVTVETAPTHPGLQAIGIPWEGAGAHAESMRDARRSAALIVLVRDRDGGRVGLRGEVPGIAYRLSSYDARHLAEGLVRTAELAFAAGARRVRTLHAVPLTLERWSRADAERRMREGIAQRGLAPNRIGLFSAHQMGSARLRARLAEGVGDPDGRVHGTRGLWIGDASAFPAASGVNPMMTVMAMARRTAAGIPGP